MYRKLIIRDLVKLPPELIGKEVNDALLEAIKNEYEGKVSEETGIILQVLGIKKVGEGKVFPMDPTIHYMVEFEAISYKPDNHEVVIGKVVENSKFGAFIRIGPLDGLVHISQIMDDFVTYDEKNQMFMGKNTKRVLKVGDWVRARIISVSFDGNQFKVGLTMRQPGLGSLAWIEEEKKQLEKEKKKK